MRSTHINIYKPIIQIIYIQHMRWGGYRVPPRVHTHTPFTRSPRIVYVYLHYTHTRSVHICYKYFSTFILARIANGFVLCWAHSKYKQVRCAANRTSLLQCPSFFLCKHCDENVMYNVCTWWRGPVDAHCNVIQFSCIYTVSHPQISGTLKIYKIKLKFLGEFGLRQAKQKK